jgi:Leucine-rich repeat (LRR) protein
MEQQQTTTPRSKINPETTAASKKAQVPSISDLVDYTNQQHEEEIEIAIKEHFYKCENKFITQMPPHILKSKELRTELEVLFLKNNCITEFPHEIINLENLKCLDVSYNKISKLSTEFMTLTRLIGVDLSYNSIEKIPSRWLPKLSELRFLNLDHNLLRHIPSTISLATQLTHLQLSGNKLSSIPPEIEQLKNLKILHLKQNRLKSLPKELGKLKALEELYLDRNKLTSLPEDLLSGLTQLKHFSIAHNLFSDASTLKDINKLKFLEELKLSSNKFTTLPNFTSDMANLIILDLSKNHLKSLPTGISEIGDHLQYLDISHNNLSALSHEVKHLISLKYLSLCYNQLLSLPIELGYCRNLKVLRASHNSIQTIHSSCFNLGMSQLIEVHLDYNKLTSLPNTLHECPELLQIFVEGNNLVELPPNLYQCPKLISLQANRNRIRRFPENISKFSKLSKLYLHHNEITSIPKSIIHLKRLRFLNLDDNPIMKLISENGVESVLEDDEEEITEPQAQQQQSTEIPSVKESPPMSESDNYTRSGNVDCEQQQQQSESEENNEADSYSMDSTAETERTIEDVLNLPKKDYGVCRIM